MTSNSTAPPSRAAFYEAFRDGDLAVIAAYLAQPRVRSDVARTEAQLAAAPRPSRFHAPTPIAWYDEPWGTTGGRSLLRKAAWHGHTHIVAWFYTRENATQLGATLALQLRAIVGLTGARDWYLWTGFPAETIELLLTCDVFRDGLADNEQHDVLQTLLANAQSAELVALVVAHGARVDDAGTLRSFARYVNHPGAVDAIVQEGARVVGAPHLLEMCALADFGKYAVAVAERFLAHGADWGNATGGQALRVAAKEVSRHQHIAFVYIQRGFCDVDACGANDGVTPLMVVAFHDAQFERLNPNLSRTVAELLLAYGADVHRETVRGETAVDFAIRAGNTRVERLLRAVGATAKSEWRSLPCQ